MSSSPLPPLLVVLALMAYAVRRLFGHLHPRLPPATAPLAAPTGASVSLIPPPPPEPLKPLHRRQVLRDARLLPRLRPPPWQAPPARLLSADEAGRLFADTVRTRDPRARVLLADPGQLARLGLPPWRCEVDVASALDLSVARLRHFSSHRQRERVVHYVQFAVPKRSGGERVILAPKRELKALLRRLNTLLVERLPVSEHAHGFRRHRSIATHAAAHVGQRVVVRLDIKDFFPSLHVGRARGLLIALGYSHPVAAILATLMTEAVRQPVRLGGECFFVPAGSRHLPQGAPTSPGMANALALSMDRRLAGVARKLGFAYTRYADDLTFSGPDIARARSLIHSAQRIVNEEGFALNPSKTRVLTQRGAQRITGVTVNREMGLSRHERRRLRAALHQASKGTDTSVWRRLQGRLAYLSMLNPRQAQALRARHEPR